MPANFVYAIILSHLISEFRNKTPYPSWQLADVWAAIAFYLRHKQDVEVYLQQRQQQANEIRKQKEAKFVP